MTVAELRKRCTEAPTVRLVLKRRKPPRGRTVRLLDQRRGPAGKYVSWIQEDLYLVEFRSDVVLAWLDKHGMHDDAAAE